MKYQIRFNTHRYQDQSDRPRSSSKVIEAADAEAARDQLETMRELGVMINLRYIGLIFEAEPVTRVTR